MLTETRNQSLNEEFISTFIDFIRNRQQFGINLDRRHSFLLHFEICNLAIKNAKYTQIFISNCWFLFYNNFEIRFCCNNFFAETSKVARDIFQKEVRLQLGNFPSFITGSLLQKHYR